MKMPYQLAISLDDAGADALVVTDGTRHICVGTVADDAIRLITPNTFLSEPPECLAYPRDLMDDDKPVRLDGEDVGSGFGCLAAAVHGALMQSPLVAGADLDDSGDVIRLTVALEDGPAASPAGQIATPPRGSAGLAPATPAVLPRITPQANLLSVKQAISAQLNGTAPTAVAVDWALMKTPHPNGSGIEAIVVAPANATVAGLPAFMIGELDDINDDCRLDGTFVPLPAGLPLQPLRLPDGAEVFGGKEIDEEDLVWFLQHGLAHMVDPWFANIAYDPGSSGQTGAATYHASIGGHVAASVAGTPGAPAASTGQAIPASGQTAATQAGAGQAGSGRPDRSSTLPADAPLPDLDEAVAGLAKAADANPEILEKLAGIAGLEDEVRKRKSPAAPAPIKPLFGGWG